MAFFNNTIAHDSQLRRKRSINSLHKEKTSPIETRRPADERKNSSSRPSPIDVVDVSFVPRRSEDNQERQRRRPSLESSSTPAMTTNHTKRGVLAPAAAKLVIHVPPPNYGYDTADHDHITTRSSQRHLNTGVKRPATSPSWLPSTSSPSRLMDSQSRSPGLEESSENPSLSRSQTRSPTMYSHPSPGFVEQGGGRGSSPSSPLPIGPGLNRTSNTAPSSPSPSLRAGFRSAANSSPTARSFTSARSSPVRRVPVPAYDPNPSDVNVTLSAGASMSASASRSTSALGYAGSGSRNGSTSNLSHSAEGPSGRLVHAFAHAYAHKCAPSPAPGDYADGSHQQSIFQKKPRNILRKASITRKEPQGLQRTQQAQLLSGSELHSSDVDTATATAIAAAVAAVDATGSGHPDREKETHAASRGRSKGVISKPFKPSKDKAKEGKRSKDSSLARNTRLKADQEVIVPMSAPAHVETPLTPAREVVMAYYQQTERKGSKEKTREIATMDSSNLDAIANGEANDNDPAADIAVTGAATTTTTSTATKATTAPADTPYDRSMPQHAAQPNLIPLTPATGKIIALGSPSDGTMLDSDRRSLDRLSFRRHSDASSTRSFNITASAASKGIRRIGSRSRAHRDPTENFAVGGKSAWVPPWGAEVGAGADKGVDKRLESVDKPRESESVAKRPSTAGAAFGGTGFSAATTKETQYQTQGPFRSLSRKLSARLVPTLAHHTQESQSHSQSDRKLSPQHTPSHSQSEFQSQRHANPDAAARPHPRHTYSHSQGHVGKRRSLSGALDFFTAGLAQAPTVGRAPLPMGAVVTPKPTVHVSSPTASATHRRPQSPRLPRMGGWPGRRDRGGDAVDDRGVYVDLGATSYVDGRERKKPDEVTAESGETGEQGRVWEDSIGDWVTRQTELQKHKDIAFQRQGENTMANFNPDASTTTHVSISSPSSPTSGLSNSKRLWRLVKRFSSGNLKDKKATMGGKAEIQIVPPVPPLPPLPVSPLPKPVGHLKGIQRENQQGELELPTSPRAITSNHPSTTTAATPRRWRSATATTVSSSSPSTASATTSGVSPRSRSSSAAGSESSYGEDIMYMPPVPVPELPLQHQKGQLQGDEPREGKTEDDGRTGGGGAVLRRRTTSTKTSGKDSDGAGNNGEGQTPSPAGSATIPTFDSTNPVNAFSGPGSRKASSSNSSTSTKRGHGDPSWVALPLTAAAWSNSEQLQAQSQSQTMPPIPPRSPHRSGSKKQSIPDTRTGTSEAEAQTRRPSGGNVQARPDPKDIKPRPRSMSDGDIAAEQERQSQSQTQPEGETARPSGEAKHATSTTTSRFARTESPGPSFMFRELSSSARGTLTEWEKTAKWEELLQKSARAGGTLHVVDASMSGRRRARRRSHDSGGGLGVNLWSDERSSMRTSIALSETSSAAGDLAA